MIREDNAWLGKTIAYTYDNGGNILSVSEYAITSASDISSMVASSTDTYTYGDSNWKDKLTSFNGNAITYDEIGNPLTYYNGLTFDWQNGRQLASVNGTGRNFTYTYNSDGIRTSKTINGVTTTYTLEGSNIVKETNGTDTIWYFYDASGSLTGFELNGTPYFYVKNIQGDITAITNQNGDIVAEYTYDSWGKLVSITGSCAGSVGAVNHFLYRGYYYDYELGFYYLNSRYYDPSIKRFINADGYASTGMELNANNTYTYCLNNPIDKFDSFGTHPADLYPEYETMDEAAIAAAEYIGQYSFGEFKGDFYCFYEYGVCIYEVYKDGKIGYNFDPDTLWTDYKNFSVHAKFLDERIDGAYDAVAFVHTHPYSYIPNGTICETVSPTDVDVARRTKKTVYAYAYDGTFSKYDPKQGKISVFDFKLPIHKASLAIRNILNSTGTMYLKPSMWRY